jgi:hypothetical protein
MIAVLLGCSIMRRAGGVCLPRRGGGSYPSAYSEIPELLERDLLWMTMLAFSTLPVPLAILARPRMDELKFGFNLLFATIDIFFVAVVVNWVRPTEE